MKKVKLDPMCFKDFPMSITNQGYLLPCCYCDDPVTMNDPAFQKLVQVSKISDHESIQDILAQKEWKDFEKNLKKNIGPPACINTCQIRKNKNDIVRKDTHIDPKNRKIKRVRNV